MTNYQRPMTLLLLSSTLIALLAGCRPITAKPGAVTTAPVTETAVAAADATGQGTLSDDEQLVATAAAEQVALTSNKAAGDVHLTSMEAVEWSDASLGCPQPDMMYAQVITPGYLLVFDAGGQSVEVHTDMQQPPQIVICQP